MCRKRSLTKRPKIVTTLPRVAAFPAYTITANTLTANTITANTITANTLTANTFSLKSPGEDIQIPCTYILYILFVFLLFVSVSEVLL